MKNEEIFEAHNYEDFHNYINEKYTNYYIGNIDKTIISNICRLSYINNKSNTFEEVKIDEIIINMKIVLKNLVFSSPSNINLLGFYGCFQIEINKF